MPPVVAAVVAFAIPATAATAITVFGTAISFASIIGYVGYTALTVSALKKLSAQAMAGVENKGTLFNIREAAGAQEYVYGQVRKGGVLTYIDETGTDNKYLHIVIVLAGHEVEEIGDIYINDEVVTIDGSGIVTTDRWKSKIRIIKRDGSQTTASSTIVADTGVASTFIGKGIAHLYIRLQYDADVFGSGIPTFTAVVKGKKVYDPRTSTTVWSANAALCIRDYITSAYGLADSTVNDTFFSAAANDCDDNIPIASGGTQDRYTINGVVRADSTTGSALADMMQSCNGALYYSGGEWKLRVGVYEAPVKSFTLDDLRSAITLPTKMSRRDNFNSVIGTFINSSAGWVEADYPPVTSAYFLDTEDNSIENAMDLPLMMVTNGARAQRIAKQALFRSREQMTISADFGLSALGVEVGDIVDLTIADYGWTNKEFEVKSWKLVISEEGGIRVSLILRETSEEAFAWDAEEQEIVDNNSNLPAYYDVGNVGVSLTSELRLVNQQVVGALLVSVTTNSDQADQFEVQYRQYGATAWKSLGRSTSNDFEAVGVTDGAFDVRARAINAIGIRGDWTTISNFYITLFAALPQDVEDFSANVVGNTLHLTWTPSPDLDLSHYKIRYARAISGASYQNAVDVVEKVSRPANSVVIPAKTGTYFIKAVDKLGNLSANSTSIVVVTNVSDIDALNVVETRQQDPSFTGTKSSVVLTSDDYGPYITLNTVTLFDSYLGNFDDALGLFDGGGGSVATSGIYYFDNYVDLGAKYVSRVKTDIDVDFLDYVNTFDDAGGNFDARSGNFDGDPSQFDSVSVITQMAYTDDDPAGSPTWSAWRNFIVGDIAARAIKFRAVLKSEAAGGTFAGATTAPAVRILRAIVDMPDRVESASDITYTGTYPVTFPAAFKVTPAIGIATSLANGDRYAISGKSRTGFTITTYTGASVSTNPATFDYVAKGYGKGLT
jgi:hypothetical protein